MMAKEESPGPHREGDRQSVPARAASPRMEKSSLPLLNAIETGEKFILEIALPGFNKDSVYVRMKGKNLEVSAEPGKTALPKDAKYRHREFDFFPLNRIIPLPGNADGEQIRAVFSEGLLTITIPKKFSDSLGVLPEDQFTG